MYSFLATPYFHRFETGAFPHTGKQPSNYTVLGQSCHLVTGARNCFLHHLPFSCLLITLPSPAPKQGHCIHVLLCLQSSINSNFTASFFFFNPRTSPHLHFFISAAFHCLPMINSPSSFFHHFFYLSVTPLRAYMARPLD